MAHAQRSEPCDGTWPCVDVGAGEHEGHFGTDADHFVYCPPGSEENGVEVTVISEFFGTPCTSRCTHPPRDLTWGIAGAAATELESTDASDDGVDFASAHVTYLVYASPGDSITVTCTVGDASTQGECDEKKQGGYYEHIGDHGGAAASCTIKFWRMELEANVDLDPLFGYPHYEFEFATDVSNTATVSGGSAIEYLWKSYVGGVLHKQVTTGIGSWSGEIVAYTGVECRAKVVNACDPTTYRYKTQTIFLSPSIRRPGWTMEASLGGEDLDWLSGQSDAFPQINVAKWTPPGAEYAYGQNTNLIEKYKDYATVIVTPIYQPQENLPNDFDDFEDTTELVESGPNEGFFYNDDPNFFAVKRLARSNHWIKSGLGQHPAVPALDMDGNGYTDWASLLAAKKGPHCKCLYPADHDGQLADTHYQGNLRHEKYGSSYLGTPNPALGHQGLLEDAVLNDDPIWFDAVYLCDLLYADSLAGLCAADEGNRAFVSGKLLARTLLLHEPWYLNSTPAGHNYTGDIPIYESGSGWREVNVRF